MKKYQTPKLEYVELQTQDIMNTSPSWGFGEDYNVGVGNERNN